MTPKVNDLRTFEGLGLRVWGFRVYGFRFSVRV